MTPQSQEARGPVASKFWEALRRPRVRVLISATAALIFLLSARWWLIGQHTTERREELRSLLSSVLEATRYSVRSWSTTTRVQATWKADAPQVRTLVSTLAVMPRARESLVHSQAAAKLAEFLHEGSGLSETHQLFERFLVVAPDGFVLAAADKQLVGTILSLTESSPWYSALHGAAKLGPVEQATAARAPEGFVDSGVQMVVAAPVREPSGEVIAALGFAFDGAAELERLVRTGQVGQSGRTYAFADNRRWLTFTGVPSGAYSEAETLSPYPVPSSVGDADDPSWSEQGWDSMGVDVSGYAGRFGDKVVGAWCELPELGIGLATEMDFDEAFRPLRRLRRIMVAFNVIAVLLVLGLVALSRQRQDVAPSSVYQPKRSLAPWAILAVSLVATLLLWHSSRTRIQEFDQARFDREVVRFQKRLAGSLERQGEALRAVQAAYDVFHNLNRVQWEQFVEALQLQEVLSAQYIAFVEHVPAERLRAHETAVRADGLARYHVRPQGSRPDYFPIRHVEPMPEGADRLGFDIGSVPSLRQQAELSARTGRLTRRYIRDEHTLAGDGAAIVTLVPIYRRGANLQNPDERRRANRGWVAALVSPSSLFEAVSPGGESGIDVEAFAGSELESSPLIYDRNGIVEDERGAHRGPFHTVASIDAGASVWTLSFAADRTFGASSWQNLPAQVLLGGLAISVLLFDIALVLSSTRSSALAMADLLTRRVRESEARIRAVIDQAPDGIITFNHQGAIETFNPGAEKLFGYSADEVRGVSLSKLMASCLGPEGEWPLSCAGDGVERKLTSGCEVTGTKKDGTEFPIELTISKMEIETYPMFTAIVRDVSERKRAEAALRESEQRYALAARAVNDGLWDWNLKTDEIYYSPRWRAGLGFEENDLEGLPDEWFSRVHEEDRPVLFSALRRHLENRSPQFQCEYRMRHRDGGYRWMLSRGIAVRDENGTPIRLAGSQTDVTARKHAENRLLHEAFHDPLTELPNRTYFMERLEAAAQTAIEKQNKLFAVLFLDVDRFKVVNDSLGHMVGDELLVAIAGRLKRLLRPDDVIARLGGDEFAVLLENLSQESEAAQIAERLHRGLTEPFSVGEQEVFANASIGIAFSTGHRETPVDLLRNADTAMYRAKSSGKACYETFDEGMHVHAVELLQLETSLRRALEREEFRIYYQPIVSLSSGDLTSCEALLRWEHPERGIVLPGEFIPVAEETGLIIPISEWVLQQTCRQVTAWEKAGLGRMPVSVNVSPRQLKSTDLFETVLGVLAETRLDPGLLKLELTESGLMGNADSAVKTLFRLYAKGIEISLDDFGTGYSSLTYLRRFPITCLKVDKSFVSEIATEPGDAAIATGVIGLAHSLDLKVIFEGVETEEQLQFLRANNCDEVQGIVICPPLDQDSFARLLEERMNGVRATDNPARVHRSSLIALGGATTK